MDSGFASGSSFYNFRKQGISYFTTSQILGSKDVLYSNKISAVFVI